ncbi:MAG: hypothetical protein KZQ64_02420 [gamma proteobacterium symbiont of Bathyaustriella thionipta]|nr:hypothetical protein [gamma proteobacterium symbiont of Bathyaustriella thionipta]MCU7949137.1 hypothetical protein [gamma proteobacterium symbiont of Bathyaustriella thionipta]MCU7952244.1 hypothetical protein [gamma proteobacterium symbiont of Bathyaustriella thionipta]MCU7955794.1 hypothetical protein [gamma proteobacterium symbiont of Bathyaustriella thionipta]MCU7968038.1 hypothetical protein [gamma proteobacterium symbiont of Bathyaustriella thionipta]
MFKPTTLIIVLILFVSGYWFYHSMVTPQGDGTVRVKNLPWQITVVDEHTLHVFELDVGKATLGDAVKILKSEYNLAWFENQDDSISLEAYFIRVSMSGLRAKVLLELSTDGLDIDYLKKNSGKPEIQTSRTIKYPLDDLAQELDSRVIRSLTYIPKSSVDAELLKSRFGQAEEILKLNKDTEFWLYPQKGLVISISQKGKEVLQYIPVGEFERLRKSVQDTVEHAKNHQAD